jgi:UDP-glucose 4-epimerase
MDLGIGKFILFPTAVLYGQSKQVPKTESERVNPIKPYSWSKIFIVKVLEDLLTTKDIPYITLRYFNAAGADFHSRIDGECHNT